MTSEQATYTYSSEILSHAHAHAYACTHAFTATYTHNSDDVGLLTPVFILAGKSMYVINCSSNIWNTVKSEYRDGNSLNRDRSKAITVHLHVVLTQLIKLTYGKRYKCLAYDTGTWKSLTVAPSLDDKNLGYVMVR